MSPQFEEDTRHSLRVCFVLKKTRTVYAPSRALCAPPHTPGKTLPSMFPSARACYGTSLRSSSALAALAALFRNRHAVPVRPWQPCSEEDQSSEEKTDPYKLAGIVACMHAHI